MSDLLFVSAQGIPGQRNLHLVIDKGVQLPNVHDVLSGTVAAIKDFAKSVDPIAVSESKIDGIPYIDVLKATEASGSNRAGANEAIASLGKRIATAQGKLLKPEFSRLAVLSLLPYPYTDLENNMRTTHVDESNIVQVLETVANLSATKKLVVWNAPYTMRLLMFEMAVNKVRLPKKLDFAPWKNQIIDLKAAWTERGITSGSGVSSDSLEYVAQVFGWQPSSEQVSADEFLASAGIDNDKLASASKTYSRLKIEAMLHLFEMWASTNTFLSNEDFTQSLAQEKAAINTAIAAAPAKNVVNDSDIELVF